jgi:hypothetical protein
MHHVYKLTNVKTGIPYFGETTSKKLATTSPYSIHPSMPFRQAEHLGHMELGIHSNVHMQNAWDNGDIQWTFEVIETVEDRKTARAVEKAWARATPNCYNIKYRPISNGVGAVVRMTSAERAEIVQLLKQGMRGSEISKRTGRSTAIISMMRTQLGIPVPKTPLSVMRRSIYSVADLATPFGTPRELADKALATNIRKKGGALNVTGAMRSLGHTDKQLLGRVWRVLRDANQLRGA